MKEHQSHPNPPFRRDGLSAALVSEAERVHDGLHGICDLVDALPKDAWIDLYLNSFDPGMRNLFTQCLSASAKFDDALQFPGRMTRKALNMLAFQRSITQDPEQVFLFMEQCYGVPVGEGDKSRVLTIVDSSVGRASAPKSDSTLHADALLRRNAHRFIFRGLCRAAQEYTPNCEHFTEKGLLNQRGVSVVHRAIWKGMFKHVDELILPEDYGTVPPWVCAWLVELTREKLIILREHQSLPLVWKQFPANN